MMSFSRQSAVADLILSAARFHLVVVICPSTALKLSSIVLKHWFRLIGWPSAITRLQLM